MRQLLCSVVLGALTGSAAAAQGVSARADVDSTSFLVGDWIHVRVHLTHPAGIVFTPLVADTVGAYTFITRDSLQRTSETQTATTLVFAKYDSGSAVLPPIPFLYTLPMDTSSRIVATNPLVLTTRTLPVDTSQGIKDITPPLWMSLTLAEIALYLGILLLAAAIAFVMYRLWKKKQLQRKGEVYVPPPRPAHVIALEELAVLKEKKLWQRGLVKQYYSEVTEIVRRYFENRYGCMALEQTTDEIMHSLRQHHHAEPILAETEEMLRTADLVKFAKYQPGIPEHENMLVTAYGIVEKTRVIERAPAGEEGATVHVAG